MMKYKLLIKPSTPSASSFATMKAKFIGRASRTYNIKKSQNFELLWAYILYESNVTSNMYIGVFVGV